MPNHVHLILTPSDEAGLGLAVGEAHRRYTNFVNARGRWTGHLFQSRFASVVMDEDHLLAAARYVPMNPVRARLVACAEEWPWSSARAHLAGKDDSLATTGPLKDRIGDFDAFLSKDGAPAASAALRAAETTGRPLGNAAFIDGLERILGRRLARGRPGPAPIPAPDIAQRALWG